MIGYLTGTVQSNGTRGLILDVSGVGYLVSVPAELIERSAVGSPLSLWVHTIVREDVLDLYGFELEDELEFFKLLITVSGIGPKSALGILNVAPLETLHSAITSGETVYLTKVSGVGKKSAEKIVLELRDKLPKLSFADTEAGMQENMDVLEALQALGYSQSSAREVLKGLPVEITGTGERVTEALKRLGGSQ